MVCCSGEPALILEKAWTPVGGGANIMRLGPTMLLFVILFMHSLSAVSHLDIPARQLKLIHLFNWD